MAMTLTPDDIIAIRGAIFIDVRDGADSNPGTPTDPVQSVQAARAAADAAGVKEYQFRGAITLEEDHDRWGFVGLSAGFLDEVVIAGFSVDEAKFDGCKITGAADNSRIEATNCVLNFVSGCYGIFHVCCLLNTFFVDNDRASRNYIFERSFSAVIGGDAVIDLASLATDDEFAHTVQFNLYSGGIDFINSTANHSMEIDVLGGKVDIEASCTLGTLRMLGIAEHTDNSGPNFIVTDELIHGSTVELSRKLLQNEAITDPVTGKMTVADDDGSALVEADIFQDAAGSLAYNSSSLKIERRDRLE